MPVAVLDALDGDLVGDVRALINAVKVRDGAPPLSEHAMLQLGLSRPGLRHLVVPGGYAQLDDDTAEIADRDGVADQLLAALEPFTPHLIVWSHGQHSPVAPAATARGYTEHRKLWQLRRPLTDLPDKPLPQGVTVRAFVPGQDEDAWLAVNAAAFADHAEQGRWTHTDIEAREAEAWFDPAGFLLAERDGELLGFHWTKVHRKGAGTSNGVGKGAGIGEVYVLGIAPAAQGLGLGPALLTAGLAHLAGRGVAEVLLYVDESNPGAVQLYRKYGFTTYDVDVQLIAHR
jgi:mycothiol synthase